MNSALITEVNPDQIIIPDWEAPDNIHSISTTRQGGFSAVPYDSFNLGTHVDDSAACVKKNRQLLTQFLPSEPVWLNQIHSHRVVNAADVRSIVDADGSYSTKKNQVSVVMTADCLPVLVCTRQGDAVAALHAGWRGLLHGILEQGILKMLAASQHQPEDCLIWFGPAIGSRNFEVGDEVRQAFLQKTRNKKMLEECFVLLPGTKKKYLMDIYQLAKQRLLQMGVENFSGGRYCTYTDKEKFFSYRRDGVTGRMASLIWIK